MQTATAHILFLSCTDKRRVVPEELFLFSLSFSLQCKASNLDAMCVVSGSSGTRWWGQSPTKGMTTPYCSSIQQALSPPPPFRDASSYGNVRKSKQWSKGTVVLAVAGRESRRDCIADTCCTGKQHIQRIRPEGGKIPKEKRNRKNAASFYTLMHITWSRVVEVCIPKQVLTRMIQWHPPLYCIISHSFKISIIYYKSTVYVKSDCIRQLSIEKWHWSQLPWQSWQYQRTWRLSWQQHQDHH